MSTPEIPIGDDRSRPARTATWKWVAGIAAGVAVVAIAVAAFAVTRDDSTANTGSTLGAQRIAATRSACRQWFDTSPSLSGAAANRGWCDDMTQWMNDHMSTGGMMGSAAWASPQAMIDACRRWTASLPSNGTTATTSPTTSGWCDQMVGWMSQHMGNWSNSNDWDHHMDDGHWND